MHIIGFLQQRYVKRQDLSGTPLLRQQSPNLSRQERRRRVSDAVLNRSHPQKSVRDAIDASFQDPGSVASPQTKATCSCGLITRMRTEISVWSLMRRRNLSDAPIRWPTAQTIPLRAQESLRVVKLDFMSYIYIAELKSGCFCLPIHQPKPHDQSGAKPMNLKDYFFQVMDFAL